VAAAPRENLGGGSHDLVALDVVDLAIVTHLIESLIRDRRGESLQGFAVDEAYFETLLPLVYPLRYP